MKITLTIVLVFHGIVHLLGFAKAFSLAPLSQLKNKVSKFNGILWLCASALYLLMALLLLTGNNSWTLLPMVALPISQYLIVISWKDSRWGSLVNTVILAAAITSYSSWRFNSLYENEVRINLTQSFTQVDSLLSEFDLVELPQLVQNYIRYSGAVGKPKVRNFKVEFSGQIRKNEALEWMPFTSQQYNFVTTSTRLFFMNAVMKNLPVAGFHSFRNGQAAMDIRLLSLFKVQYQSGKEMGIAETVTFFNDMCCMAPATLIDKRIKWIEVGEHYVKAQFTNNNISISAKLYFNDKGELINFISNDRYAVQENNTMKQLPWSTPLKNYKDFNGHKLPAYAEAIYNYPQGSMTYGTFVLRNIEYNCKDL
jgi:hypothetical protein